MKQNLLAEEKFHPEFTVWNTNRVNCYLEKVIEYNADKPAAVKSLVISIEVIQRHLSFRSMGLGYGISNPFRELGLCAYYTLQYDLNNRPYISVYKL